MTANKNETGGLSYEYVGMSMSEIKELVVSTYIGGLKRKRRPKPIFCWGAPGEGKTFTMYAAAREIGRRLGTPCILFDVPSGTLEPTDLSGIPWPIKIKEEAMFYRYVGPEWGWFASKQFENWMKEKDHNFVASPAIIHIDDLVSAHFQTQNAFFKGVHEGKWGNLVQRDNVMTIGCGNRLEDNAGANDMPTPLANRFRHCYALPKTEDWLRWGSQFREEGEEGITGENRIHPIIIGYIRTRNDVLREFNSDIANRSEKAFASPRTWEDVSEVLWEGEIRPDNPIFSRTIMGIVGYGQATEFLGYLRNSTSLVPPDEIVKNPKKAKIPSKQNLDAIHATIASLELYIKQHPEHWKAGLIYAMRDTMIPDIGILLAQTISEIVVGFSSQKRAKALTDDIFSDALDKYKDLIDIVDLK